MKLQLQHTICTHYLLVLSALNLVVYMLQYHIYLERKRAIYYG